jgi:hypothetical protein
VAKGPLRALPEALQTRSFDDRLLMGFLAGEAVVDNSLRLKRTFDRTRLWINACASEVRATSPRAACIRTL